MRDVHARLQRALCTFFRLHIRLVLRHPAPFLLVPLACTALLGSGLILLPDAMVKDELELYTPTNARARHELRELDALFHINDTDPFYASRRYDLKRTGYIILTGGDDADILNPAFLKAAAHLWSIIQSFTIDPEPAPQDRSGTPLIDYASLCVRFPLPDALDRVLSNAMNSSAGDDPHQFCVSNPLLELFKLALDASIDPQSLTRNITADDVDVDSLSAEASALLEEALSLNAFGTGMLRGLLGGVTRDSSTHRVAGAKALMLPYALRHGTQAQDALAERWELALDQFLAQFRSPLIQANWWTYETLAAESARDRARLRAWLLPCLLAVSLLSVLLCCTSSPIHSRPLLALSGVLAVSAAIASGMGLLLWLRFPVTSVTLSMPFIVFSVGVDNVFILLAAWRATSLRMSLRERMECTFGDAGVSITITSLTDLLSFSVGCLTPFPSVQMFCLFSAVCLLFSYVYQLTIFASLMCLTSLREVQHRHCLTMRRLRPHEQQQRRRPISTSSIYAIVGFGSAASVVHPKGQSKSAMVHSADADDSNDDALANLALSRFFRSHFASLLLNKFVQAAVLALFGLYLLISAYGCTNIELGLEPLDLLPDSSHGKRALRVTEQYFPEHVGHLHVWMHGLSRVRLGHRRLWLVLEKEIELYEHTEFTGAADSWLRTFLHLQHAHGILTAKDNFVPRLKQFLAMPRHRKYRRDVRFTTDGAMLEASRVTVRLRSVGHHNQSRAMHLFRLLAESSELPTGVYADFFTFAEQYTSLVPATISSIAMAGLSVVLVSLVLIPAPAAALWVSFSIVSINLGVLGLMPFLSLRLDFISMVTIVMSIGFCVDFSAHLAYNFARGPPGQSAQLRLRNALYTVGTPICQSASSTVLGVSFLALTESYIFHSFCKTIVLVITLGVLHGLIILPVLLTVVQRGEEDDELDHDQQIRHGKGSQLTATEISAPLPAMPSFSNFTPKSPFNVAMLMSRRTMATDDYEEGEGASPSSSPYSRATTIPIGSIFGK